MARFSSDKKYNRSRKAPLFRRVKGRQHARRRTILPKRGMNQTSYESGFFDFLKVFWKNNVGMDVCKLTKQVAKAWEALLPRPKKLSKQRLLRDYRPEYQRLQREKEQKELKLRLEQFQREEEEEKLRQEELERERRLREETKGPNESTSNTTRTSAGQSGTDVTYSRSRSDIEEDDEDEDEDEDEDDDDDASDQTNDSATGESDSQYESKTGSSESVLSDHSLKKKNSPQGRKYRDYQDYLRSKNQKTEIKKDDNNNADKGESGNKQGGATEGLYFPARAETNFDRIVKANINNQAELLKNLKMYNPHSNQNIPKPDDLNRSDDSVIFIERPTISKHSPISNWYRRQPKLIVAPTNVLHATNLIIGIKQPELKNIFNDYLEDIVLIKVLQSEFRGEALLEFKNEGAAEKAWKEMNGVQYKHLPMILEFAEKKDLLLY